MMNEQELIREEIRKKNNLLAMLIDIYNLRKTTANRVLMILDEIAEIASAEYDRGAVSVKPMVFYEDPKVVRCCECMFYDRNDEYEKEEHDDEEQRTYYCPVSRSYMSPTDYCSMGEKIEKEGEENQNG